MGLCSTACFSTQGSDLFLGETVPPGEYINKSKKELLRIVLVNALDMRQLMVVRCDAVIS